MTILKEIALMVKKRSGQRDMQSIYKIINLDAENISMSSAEIFYIIYWLTINAFKSFNSRNPGVYSYNIFFAGLYTFYLTMKLDLKDKSTE